MRVVVVLVVGGGNGEGHRNSAVSLYLFEIPHFPLVEEPKVVKNYVGDFCSALPKLCILFVLKIRYVQIYTIFVS